MRLPLLATETLWIAALSLAACGARAEVTATRKLTDSVRVPGDGAPTVIVRNVLGSIRVTAYDGDTVEMTATETVTGDLQADIARARAAVELRTETEQGRVAFRVRRVGAQADADCGRWVSGADGYRVAYDIEVRVPRAAAIELATVNGGEIVADGVRGHFEVRNVNGGVRLNWLRGSGVASTVNGPLSATFERAPADATSFKTVNGKIEVSFPENLAADLKLKTLHGEIYTDFDARPLAAAPVGESSRDDGRLVIRTQRESTLRVGAGGPAYSFETLSGDVYVRKANR